MPPALMKQGLLSSCEGIRRLVYESVSGQDRANPLRARYYRLATVGISLFGGFCVLYSGLDAGAVAFSNAGRGDLAIPATIRLAWVGMAAAVSALHISYLLLVSDLLILSQPVESLRFQRFVLPLLLLIAYLAYAVVPLSEQWFGYPFAKIALRLSYAVFAALYFYWFLRDTFELYETTDRKRRRELRVWRVVEGALGALLALEVLHASPSQNPTDFLARRPSPGNLLAGFISWNDVQGIVHTKDVAVLVCLGFYVVWRYLDRGSAGAVYSDVYTSYLSHVVASVPTLSPGPRAALRGVRSRVCDYGCGNGERTLQLLTMLGDSGSPYQGVDGFDPDGSWEDGFLSRLPKGTRFFSRRERVRPNDYGLVHVSHLAYDYPSVGAVAEFLRKCKPGTIVVVRGCSVRSPFTAVSSTTTASLFDEGSTHLWERSFLLALAERAGLERVSARGRRGDPGADAKLEQVYSLRGKGLQDLCSLLCLLYGERATERTRHYLSRLRETGADSIPNDDVIYFFRRKA